MAGYAFYRLFPNLAAVLASLALSACAALEPRIDDDEGEDRRQSKAAYALGSFGKLDSDNNNTRATAAFESSAGLAGKTLLLDPVVRPISTLKALYGATLKSTGGFVDRKSQEYLVRNLARSS